MTNLLKINFTLCPILGAQRRRGFITVHHAIYSGEEIIEYPTTCYCGYPTWCICIRPYDIKFEIEPIAHAAILQDITEKNSNKLDEEKTIKLVHNIFMELLAKEYPDSKIQIFTVGAVVFGVDNLDVKMLISKCLNKFRDNYDFILTTPESRELYYTLNLKYSEHDLFLKELHDRKMRV